MNDKDFKPVSSFLTGFTLMDDSAIDWDKLFTSDNIDTSAISTSTFDRHWITAIQKVPPITGAFWYDYGKRYGEKVLMQIRPDRDPFGRKCCDVQVFSQRTVGDVVYSAWNEYNAWVRENKG